jgi:hypothetical protein
LKLRVIVIGPCGTGKQEKTNDINKQGFLAVSIIGWLTMPGIAKSRGQLLIIGSNMNEAEWQTQGKRIGNPRYSRLPVGGTS